jgi:hypothetical protein
MGACDGDSYSDSVIGSGTAGCPVPVGRIVFANTDNDASPALENAIEHGLRAAETVHRLLRPHSTRPLLRRRTLVAQPSSSHMRDPLLAVDRAVRNR